MRIVPVLICLTLSAPLYALGAGVAVGGGGGGLAPVVEKDTGEEKSEKPLPELTEEQTRKVEAAIKDLAAEDFNTRDAAHTAILETGPGALIQVEKALKANPADLEQRNRLQSIKETLTAKHLGGATREQLRAALDKTVNIQFNNTRIKDGLEQLRKDLELPEGALKADADLADRAVSLHLQGMNAKQALQWMARMCGSSVIIERHTIRIGKE